MIIDTYAYEEKAQAVTNDQQKKFNDYVYNVVYAIISNNDLKRKITQLSNPANKTDAHKTLEEFYQEDKETQAACLHMLLEQMLATSRNVQDIHIFAFKVLLIPHLEKHVQKINEISSVFLQQRKALERVKLQLEKLKACSDQDIRALYTWFDNDCRNERVFSEEVMPIVTYIKKANQEEFSKIKQEFLKFCKKKSIFFDEDYVFITTV